jgi:hypothetical protein
VLHAVAITQHDTCQQYRPLSAMRGSQAACLEHVCCMLLSLYFPVTCYPTSELLTSAEQYRPLSAPQDTGTSLIRKLHPLGPYSRHMPMAPFSHVRIPGRMPGACVLHASVPVFPCHVSTKREFPTTLEFPTKSPTHPPLSTPPQGYLAHKQTPPRTLQEAYMPRALWWSWGGGRFL